MVQKKYRRSKLFFGWGAEHLADNSPCKVAGEAVSLPLLTELLKMYDTLLKSSKQEVYVHDNCERKRTLTMYIYEWKT